MYRHCFKSDCSSPIKTRGLCNMHYLQLWKEEQSHRDPNTRKCSSCAIIKPKSEYYIANPRTGRIERRCKNCRKQSQITEKRRSYIRNYRAAKKQNGDYGKCSVCSSNLGRNEHKGRQSLGKCAKCLKLSNHWNWTGGKTINADGYVVLRYAPQKTMLEHRYVMEQHLGRKLKDDETIHHINGKRDDNRLENLELWVGAPVRGIRRDDAILWAKEILERYT